MKQTTRTLGCIAVIALALSSFSCSRVSESQSVGRQERDRKHDRRQIHRVDTAPTRTVDLSDDEVEAIDLSTTLAEERPVRHQLEAMGKVLADPKLMAIVSYAFPARISEAHVSIRRATWRYGH